MTAPLTDANYSIIEDYSGETAVAKLTVHPDTIEERGAIYTRREVVEFMLDLMNYTIDRPLYTYRLLEPAFGEGSFLEVIIQRLIAAWKQQGKSSSLKQLAQALVAVELHEDTYQKTRRKLGEVLLAAGFNGEQANQLLEHWLHQADFLLTDIAGSFTHIFGNPPYVRQELIPTERMGEYRSRYSTIYDRADLYIPFFERSLCLLAPEGQLGFICTDRWIKNRYGGPLRKYIADQFHLKYYINMVGTAAFETEVMTYPAITVIARERGTITRTAEPPAITSAALASLRASLQASVLSPSGPVEEVEGAVTGADPWILHAPEKRNLVRKLESRFPRIEETGCKVGIGVATGADKVFVAPFHQLDVEPDRKLPLVMTRDIGNKEVNWRAFGVINPFSDDGTLVNLENYPRLKKYLTSHRELVAKRHVASKRPSNWYRTIDRIYPALAITPKLLIPDIKGDAHVVYEDGKLYPHHNLYYITSIQWDLQALQVVLQSGIARLFVSIYSTQMRGGYLRFQAQYLRKICLPAWESVTPAIRERLSTSAKNKDLLLAAQAVGDLYGLTAAERELLLYSPKEMYGN